LGGGSSDAACVLHLLNDALGNPVDRASLQLMSAEIGSDVPFFLSETSAAIVQGRGEVIFPIASRSDLEALIVVPHQYRVSTRDAFSRLDEKRTEPVLKTLTRTDIEHIYRLPCSQWTFINDFLPIIDDPKEIYPVLHRYCRNLDSCFGTLSGTGSAYCCISSETTSIDALERLIVRDDNNHTLFRIKCLHT
jgi:4-diphosphocytidyl-2-C-methyl-D-erythritol kinase